MQRPTFISQFPNPNPKPLSKFEKQQRRQADRQREAHARFDDETARIRAEIAGLKAAANRRERVCRQYDATLAKPRDKDE